MTAETQWSIRDATGVEQCDSRQHAAEFAIVTANMMGDTVTILRDGQPVAETHFREVSGEAYLVALDLGAWVRP